ncbi:MAG: dirigent protein [Solirubrobacteraceae bacterium]
MPQPLANIRLSATIAVATAALAVAALLAAAPTYAKTAHAAGRTVHVVEHAKTDTEAPGVGGPDVKGNILTFNNPIYDAADKKQVGHDEGFCVRLQVKLGIWECLWTTFLKGGQITVQGPFYDTRNSELSVTGGTGAYKRARGQMDLKSRNGGMEFDFIFHLS